MTIEQLLLKWDKIFKAYTESRESIHSGCNKCKNGFIRIDKNPPNIGWSSVACECKQESELSRSIIANLKKSNLPLGYLKKNPLQLLKDIPLDLFDAEKVKVCSELGEDEKNWFYIFGNAGVGKTYMAIALAQLFLLQDKSVYFSKVPQLLESLRPDSEDRTKILKKCMKVDVLVLDDIGKEKISEWVSERLYMIIDERHSWGRKTIFTSNMDLEQLFKKSNYPLYSRIASVSILLNLTGKDRRNLN